jgi:hypothetical protein
MNMQREIRQREVRIANHHGGNLYMQTNESQNAIMHYHWTASGTITEVERIPPGRPLLGSSRATAGRS